MYNPLRFTPQNAANSLVFLFIIGMLLVAFSIIAGELYYYGLTANALAISSAATELAMLLSVIIYLRTWKKQSWQQLKSTLGISRKQFSAGKVGLGIALFLVILVLTVLINVLGYVTNTNISTGTALLLAQEPVWFYAFTVLISPICEEVLFRAFAVPRLGVIVSAVIFGLLHASYDSTFGVEIFAAFVFAILAGEIFKRTKSLYPSIIAHMLVNALAVAAFLI